ncbi:hypothetical protein GDO81_009805 [Engystomops pustulosus]|uniref:Uncharacterized protein n=1 Tax=Engystomops pustulosus TaxID=76066 RepID=A0AAV7BUG5_ENGPU|nr:hypothetical protein GDO81_009805 [Engystomops pustulosus]
MQTGTEKHGGTHTDRQIHADTHASKHIITHTIHSLYGSVIHIHTCHIPSHTLCCLQQPWHHTEESSGFSSSSSSSSRSLS